MKRILLGSAVVAGTVLAVAAAFAGEGPPPPWMQRNPPPAAPITAQTPMGYTDAQRTPIFGGPNIQLQSNLPVGPEAYTDAGSYPGTNGLGLPTGSSDQTTFARSTFR